MLKSKKADADPWEFVIMLFCVVIILGSIVFLLLQYNNISTDDRKLRAQLVINKVIAGECFSDEYATIEKERFNQNSINNCLQGLDDNTNVRLFLNDEEFYGLSRDEEFRSLANLCVQEATHLCTNMKYPITHISEEEASSVGILSVQIITT